jgi:RNA polymerase sigma-54 factor
MKQSLDLKLGQHLTITPQLQQAIRLLQLSSIELQQEIQEALESNPLLEENEREEEAAEIKGEADSHRNGQHGTSTTRPKRFATDSVRCRYRPQRRQRSQTGPTASKP